MLSDCVARLWLGLSPLQLHSMHCMYVTYFHVKPSYILPLVHEHLKYYYGCIAAAALPRLGTASVCAQHTVHRVVDIYCICFLSACLLVHLFLVHLTYHVYACGMQLCSICEPCPDSYPWVVHTWCSCTTAHMRGATCNIFGCSGLILDLQACWTCALHRVAAP